MFTYLHALLNELNSTDIAVYERHGLPRYFTDSAHLRPASAAAAAMRLALMHEKMWFAA